jgi:hypothetical protein
MGGIEGSLSLLHNTRIVVLGESPGSASNTSERLYRGFARRLPETAPQIIGCSRRHLALVTRSKRALHGGREVLVHTFELLGRICTARIVGLRGVAPEL